MRHECHRTGQCSRTGTDARRPPAWRRRRGPGLAAAAMRRERGAVRARENSAAAVIPKSRCAPRIFRSIVSAGRCLTDRRIPRRDLPIGGNAARRSGPSPRAPHCSAPPCVRRPRCRRPCVAFRRKSTNINAAHACQPTFAHRRRQAAQAQTHHGNVLAQRAGQDAPDSSAPAGSDPASARQVSRADSPPEPPGIPTRT
jgi:hypothetical protein